MKKAIVTGAVGFIGGALTKKLLEMKVIVYGVDIQVEKMNRFSMYDNFIPVCADFSKYPVLAEFIKDTEIDVFFHFAWAGGFTSALKNYTLQLENARHAADAFMAACQIGCKKFIQAGTYNEFELQPVLKGENKEPRYTCIYSTAKTAADVICRTLAYNMGIEYCTGLIPMPYGEGNYSKQLTYVVIRSLLNQISPKLVEGNETYDFVYIDDIAEAFIAIALSGKDQKGYYIGHRKLQTFKEWIIQIRDVIAPGVELKFGEYQDSHTIDYSEIDLDALYQDTGFECKADFEESIRKTADWIRQLETEERK